MPGLIWTQSVITLNSQPALVMASAWDTGTGTSDSILRDANSLTPWSEAHNGSTFQLLSVISTSGLGFPSGMTNCLRVSFNNEDSAEMRALNIWPLPNIGSSLYFRLYYRGDWPDAGFTTPEASYHSPEPAAGVCPTIWEFKLNVNAPFGASTWTLDPQAPSNAWRSPSLNKAQVYAVCWQLERSTSTNMRWANMQIRNGTDYSLIYSMSDFVNPGNSHTMQQDSGTTFNYNNSDCLRSLTCGQNGPLTWNIPASNNTYIYYGGIAVSAVGDPGPYRAGEHV